MSDPQTEEPTSPTRPTQAQLYDDLRRIGQLEDQKHAIQKEIDERTNRLRSAIPTLDKSSLLYKMLTSSLKATEQATKSAQQAAKKAKKDAKRKAAKKK